jgi:hypothetical protein
LNDKGIQNLRKNIEIYNRLRRGVGKKHSLVVIHFLSRQRFDDFKAVQDARTQEFKIRRCRKMIRFRNEKGDAEEVRDQAS